MKGKSALITKIIIFSSIFIVAILISGIYISIKKSDSRFVFLFESLDDQDTHVEVRYLNTVPGEDEITCYVKDLLLGPATNRYRPLFARGTTLNSCFVRDGMLFLDLSADALVPSGISSETEKACSLLKECIRSNFKQIDDIQVFISGIEAYKEEEALIISVE